MLIGSKLDKVDEDKGGGSSCVGEEGGVFGISFSVRDNDSGSSIFFSSAFFSSDFSIGSFGFGSVFGGVLGGVTGAASKGSTGTMERKGLKGHQLLIIYLSYLQV